MTSKKPITCTPTTYLVDAHYPYTVTYLVDTRVLNDGGQEVMCGQVHDIIHQVALTHEAIHRVLEGTEIVVIVSFTTTHAWVLLMTIATT